MPTVQPTIEFLEGVGEALNGVSLRQDRATGMRAVQMSFTQLRAIEGLNSFTRTSFNRLKLTDEEGEISIQPSGSRLITGGDDGGEFKRLEVTFEVTLEEHWERVMRFLERYAQANGMAYQSTEPS
ncbi:MAG: photosystem II reaction center protein Psb28 [Gloeomargaritaceae cyanobacterium C42_A2020_066]|nr:photosystem II reaction center protein Psb28 [Gloeomargaritaceae cyanobacterium C42_A2020_066]